MHLVGYHFNPTPRDVVRHYLPRLIGGEPMHAALRPFIHDTDIYACAPGALAAQFRALPSMDGARFFFTAVRRQRHTPGEGVRRARARVRAAGPGTWRFQSSEDVKDGSNVKIGEVRKLRYEYRNGAETEWAMDEYSCACSVKGAVAGDTERVFCRIYVSAPDDAGENAAAVTRKRPAPPPIGRPPCPKRIGGVARHRLHRSGRRLLGRRSRRDERPFADQ